MGSGHYVMYHNPDTMGTGCDQVAKSDIIATNKEAVANQIAAEGNAVIWCVGRTLREGEEKIYWLSQRIESPTVEPGDEIFSVHLVGTRTFPERRMVNITEKPYFPKIKQLLHFGVQPIDDAALISALQAEFAGVWRKKG